MKRKFLATLALMIALPLVSGCGGNKSSTPNYPYPPITSVPTTSMPYTSSSEPSVEPPVPSSESSEEPSKDITSSSEKPSETTTETPTEVTSEEPSEEPVTKIFVENYEEFKKVWRVGDAPKQFVVSVNDKAVDLAEEINKNRLDLNSSDSSIIKIDGINIFPVGAGSCYVSVNAVANIDVHTALFITISPKLEVTSVSIINKASLKSEWRLGEKPRTIQVVTDNDTININDAIAKKDLIVSANKPNIVDINGLEITPKAVGEVKITVTWVKDEPYSDYVMIKILPDLTITKISITNKDDLLKTFRVGDVARKVMVSVDNKYINVEDYINKQIIRITSSNTSAITVDKNMIKPVGTGESVITVIYQGSHDIIDSIRIKVEDKPVADNLKDIRTGIVDGIISNNDFVIFYGELVGAIQAPSTSSPHLKEGIWVANGDYSMKLKDGFITSAFAEDLILLGENVYCEGYVRFNNGEYYIVPVVFRNIRSDEKPNIFTPSVLNADETYLLPSSSNKYDGCLATFTDLVYVRGLASKDVVSTITFKFDDSNTNEEYDLVINPGSTSMQIDKINAKLKGMTSNQLFNLKGFINKQGKGRVELAYIELESASSCINVHDRPVEDGCYVDINSNGTIKRYTTKAITESSGEIVYQTDKINVLKNDSIVAYRYLNNLRQSLQFKEELFADTKLGEYISFEHNEKAEVIKDCTLYFVISDKIDIKIDYPEVQAPKYYLNLATDANVEKVEIVKANPENLKELMIENVSLKAGQSIMFTKVEQNVEDVVILFKTLAVEDFYIPDYLKIDANRRQAEVIKDVEVSFYVDMEALEVWPELHIKKPTETLTFVEIISSDGVKNKLPVTETNSPTELKLMGVNVKIGDKISIIRVVNGVSNNLLFKDFSTNEGIASALAVNADNSVITVKQDGKIDFYIETADDGKVWPAFSLPAPEGIITHEYLYLVLNKEWARDNARFAAYFYNGVGFEWVDMVLVSDNIYSVKVDTLKKWEGVIFCRMNGESILNNWDENVVWNKTLDKYPFDSNNTYTLKDGTWTESTVNDCGTWSIR